MCTASFLAEPNRIRVTIFNKLDTGGTRKKGSCTLKEIKMFQLDIYGRQYLSSLAVVSGNFLVLVSSLQCNFKLY